MAIKALYGLLHVSIINNNNNNNNKLHACANFPIQARLSFARRAREFFCHE